MWDASAVDNGIQQQGSAGDVMLLGGPFDGTIMSNQPDVAVIKS
jgi:hypothetical protein